MDKIEKERLFEFLKWLNRRIILLHNYHVKASFTCRLYDGTFAEKKLFFLRNLSSKKIEEFYQKNGIN